MAPQGQGWLLFTCCLVLGFLSCPSLAQVSRLSPTSRRLRSAQLSDGQPAQILRAELLHRDHPDSPASPRPGTTAAQRLSAAAARSKSRAAHRRVRSPRETKVSTPIAPGSFEYLITIHLGTPPQKFVVIADSGSDLVWVQCSACKRPGHVCFPSPDPYFDPTKSSSYGIVPCNIFVCTPFLFNSAGCDSSQSCYVSYDYVDGSGVAGDLSTETIALSNNFSGHPSETSVFYFGCMNNATAEFGNVDGVAGFGRGPFSLPSQITQSTANNVFSYCLVPYDASTRLTSSVQFGVTSKPYGAMVHTPILTYDITSYWVNMTGISVNGKDLCIPRSAFELNTTSDAGGTIFDSGTPLLYFLPDILSTVVESLRSQIRYPEVNSTELGSGLPLCYNLTGVKDRKYPHMSLHFAGIDGNVVEFPLARRNMFIPATADVDGVNEPGVECLAMDATDGNMIVGNIAQADHYVEYDVTNLKLGWTRSVDCSVPRV